MVRRYTKREKAQAPRPSAIWGEWTAVLRADAKPTEIQAFIDECMFASIEGVTQSFKEEGFDGTCIDFILANRERMATILAKVKLPEQRAPGEELTKEQKDEINTKEGEILRGLLIGKEMESGEPAWINYNAPLCIDKGSPAPCLGKFLDAAYEYMPHAWSTAFRDQVINLISKPEIDLAAPLCKLGDGSSIACIQKVLDDPESLVGLEKKLLSGQSLQPAFESECRTLEENAKTSCIDKVLDNLIKYGSDPYKKKYYHGHYTLYNNLLKTMMEKSYLTGFISLIDQEIFYDEGDYVSGYDKIIRRTGDRGVYREFMPETLELMIAANVFDYPRMAGDRTLCHHPMMGTPTACIDTIFALMHDRKPGSPLAVQHPRSSSRRFSILEKLLVKMTEDVKFERYTCVPLPRNTDPWVDERVNCISNVLAMPSAALSNAVFQVEPNRMREIVDASCRYAKPDGSPIDIPCFEAILRDATKKSETVPGYDYEKVVKTIVPPGTDLSKPCYNVSFGKQTSCLDLLMDLDKKNAAITEYFMNVADDPARDVSKMECTIQRSDDKWNIGRGKGDTRLDSAGPVGEAEFSAFMKKIQSPDRPPEFVVSCLDKLLVKMTAQIELPSGYGDALPRKKERYSNGPDTPPKYPNLLRAGLESLTGTPAALNSMCRFVYADANQNPKEIPIPCYQKYLEAIMPLSKTTPKDNDETYDEFIHEVVSTLDLSKNCTLIMPPQNELPQQVNNAVPCLAAMIAKYGERATFNLDSEGNTKMKDRREHRDDVRCSIIGSRRFGKILKTLPDARKILCRSIACASKVDPQTNADLRVKGKIEKIKFCDCNLSVDGRFTAEDATCFEETCYKTLAKFEDVRGQRSVAHNELHEYYHAGAVTPPLIKYIQESMPPDKQIVDDISGVYEVKTQLSPHDYHVRRYVIEFAEVINKVYQHASRYKMTRSIDTVNKRKLMELTGRPILEEAVEAAKNMSSEQVALLETGKTDVRMVPVISIYFKKDGQKVDIPPDVLKKASEIRQHVGTEGMTEAYSKRPEWFNTRKITEGYVAAIKAVTVIAEAYVNSDDKNLYFEINYTDEDGNPVYNYQIQKVFPSREEVVLTSTQKAELEKAGQITLPDGRVVKMRYNLFARPVRTSKRFSQLVELEGLPAEARKQVREAGQLAAGLPEAPMYVVITTDPRDVMRASTCQHWGSCLKLEDGGGGHHDDLPSYIKGGSYIAYITDDPNLYTPVWKGRLLMHRSTDPKLIAVQDRWFRDCGVEWIYGMPEFRRLLLDTVRTVLHDKGYNRDSARVRYSNVPPYLMIDYHENPFPYLKNNLDYKRECAVYLAGRATSAQWLEEEFIKDTEHFDDAWWDAFSQDHGFPWAEKYDQMTEPIKRAVSAGVISEDEVRNYDGRIKAALKREVMTAHRDEFVRIWANTHPQECNTPEWEQHIRGIIDREHHGKSSAQPVLPMVRDERVHQPWLDVLTTYGGNSSSCGTRQEFRVISDAEIAEIRKYRGEDFIKRVGDYKRPYPTREVAAP